MRERFTKDEAIEALAELAFCHLSKEQADKNYLLVEAYLEDLEESNRRLRDGYGEALKDKWALERQVEKLKGAS